MKELMQAIKEKWGEESGIIIYADLSGHVFNGDYYEEIVDRSLFSFENITLITLNDIEQAPLFPEEYK